MPEDGNPPEDQEDTPALQRTAAAAMFLPVVVPPAPVTAPVGDAIGLPADGAEETPAAPAQAQVPVPPPDGAMPAELLRTLTGKPEAASEAAEVPLKPPGRKADREVTQCTPEFSRMAEAPAPVPIPAPVPTGAPKPDHAARAATEQPAPAITAQAAAPAEGTGRPAAALPLAFAARLKDNARDSAEPSRPDRTAPPPARADGSAAPGGDSALKREDSAAARKDASAQRKDPSQPHVEAAETAASRGSAGAADTPVTHRPDQTANAVRASAPFAAATAAPAMEQPATSRTEPVHAPAAAVPEPEPQPASTPARDITVRLPGADERVEIRMAERAGEIRVSVHTPDQQLRGSLQDNLSELVGGLEHKGFAADTWQPRPAQGGAGTASRDAGDTAADARQNHPGGEHGRRQQQARPQWLEELEHSKRSALDWQTSAA